MASLPIPFCFYYERTRRYVFKLFMIISKELKRSVKKREMRSMIVSKLRVSTLFLLHHVSIVIHSVWKHVSFLLWNMFAILHTVLTETVMIIRFFYHVVLTETLLESPIWEPTTTVRIKWQCQISSVVAKRRATKSFKEFLILILPSKNICQKCI